MGEFGGNDYNAPLFGGKSMDEVKGYVPQIIAKITSGVDVQNHRRSIEIGNKILYRFLSNQYINHYCC